MKKVNQFVEKVMNKMHMKSEASFKNFVEGMCQVKELYRNSTVSIKKCIWDSMKKGWAKPENATTSSRVLYKLWNFVKGAASVTAFYSVLLNTYNDIRAQGRLPTAADVMNLIEFAPWAASAETNRTVPFSTIAGPEYIERKGGNRYLRWLPWAMAGATGALGWMLFRRRRRNPYRNQVNYFARYPNNPLRLYMPRAALPRAIN